jgi:hypothetical protein
VGDASEASADEDVGVEPVEGCAGGKHFVAIPDVLGALGSSSESDTGSGDRYAKAPMPAEDVTSAPHRTLGRREEEMGGFEEEEAEVPLRRAGHEVAASDVLEAARAYL